MHHRGHVTVRLMEVVEMAGLQAQQAMAEAREGIHYLRDDLETVQVLFFFYSTKRIRIFKNYINISLYISCFSSLLNHWIIELDLLPLT